jgi:hypothetical protein
MKMCGRNVISALPSLYRCALNENGLTSAAAVPVVSFLLACAPCGRCLRDLGIGVVTVFRL